MPRPIPFLLLAATAAIAQTVATPPPQGSISGAITNRETGAPMSGRTVSAKLAATGPARIGDGTVPGTLDHTADTDALGHYRIASVPPGDYYVTVKGDDLEGSRKTVHLTDSAVTDVNLAVLVWGGISGTITDSNKKSVAGATVLLLQKFYQWGKSGYAQVGIATSGPEGQYRLNWGIKPGGSYAIVARMLPREIAGISDVPEDPDKRPATLMPTYYMNSREPEGALTFSPTGGQILEKIDIRMESVKSYCAAGIMLAQGAPAALYFEIGEAGANVQGNLDRVSMYLPPHGRAASNGEFRICGLHPGDYRLIAATQPMTAGPRHKLSVVAPFSITDRDVAKLSVNAVPGYSLPGEVVWEGEPPPDPVDVKVRLSISPVTRGLGGTSTAAAIPSRFSLDNLLFDEVAVGAYPPSGYYVKDVMYGGTSVLHRSFQLGSAIGDGGLKIVVGRDGGTVSAKVTDSDGNPVASATVWFLPAGAKTAVELEGVMASGVTDASGLCTSPTFRPGKYLVFASTERLGHNAADIDKLWTARSKGSEVDLGPKTSAQVSLSPIKLF